MKLDRNINSDGRGKYALINLRTNQVQWGDTPSDDFFVIKLKDRFAEAALLAYAESAELHAKECRRKALGSVAAYANECICEATDYEEYAAEIRELARQAAENPHRKLPD